MPTEIRAYIRSLGIDAYVVGGAVRDELLGIAHRDEDFLVPGVDQAGVQPVRQPVVRFGQEAVGTLWPREEVRTNEEAGGRDGPIQVGR